MTDDAGDMNIVGSFADIPLVDPEGAAHDLRVPWPGGPISERPEVRREIVALYDAACARLGVEPRPHS